MIEIASIYESVGNIEDPTVNLSSIEYWDLSGFEKKPSIKQDGTRSLR